MPRVLYQQGWAWVLPTFSIANVFCASAQRPDHMHKQIPQAQVARILAYASSADGGSLAFTRANKPPIDFVIRKRLMASR
jgi:hypothetical protein